VNPVVVTWDAYRSGYDTRFVYCYGSPAHFNGLVSGLSAGRTRGQRSDLGLSWPGDPVVI